MIYQPKFISFDCYGTLINFEMGPTAKGLFADRIAEQRMPAFLDSFRFYRLDEVLGDWKPFFRSLKTLFSGPVKRMMWSTAILMHSLSITRCRHGSHILTLWKRWN